jgi:metal-dependent amidase/aminoacylase/carboxypeptidase family protein
MPKVCTFINRESLQRFAINVGMHSCGHSYHINALIILQMQFPNATNQIFLTKIKVIQPWIA